MSQWLTGVVAKLKERGTGQRSPIRGGPARGSKPSNSAW